jgi:hypothetical protein
MTTIAIKPEVMLQRVADEMVLLEPESGDYFTLNEVGAIIAEQSQAGKSEDEIASYLTEVFDVTLEQAQQDTQSLLEALVDAGLATHS